jgi:hypothetical protein
MHFLYQLECMSPKIGNSDVMTAYQSVTLSMPIKINWCLVSYLPVLACFGMCSEMSPPEIIVIAF